MKSLEKSTRVSRICLQMRVVLAFVAVVVTAALLSQAAQGQTFTVLYSFGGGEDGSNPQAGLILDTSGNLFGTTGYGGNASCDFSCGTVFKLDPLGNKTVLYNFSGGADGAFPRGGLLRDRAGRLYGTTNQGGAGGLGCGGGGCGTAFALNSSGKEIAIYRFASNSTRDGANPWAGLVADSDGNAYGTTPGGGAGQVGTVFEINRTGENVLYSFVGGEDGAYPYARLMHDGAGIFYGTTALGGDSSCTVNPPLGCGTIFKLDKFGGETVLYRFKGGLDGAVPFTNVARSGDALYGTTLEGGGSTSCVFGCGVVFELDNRGRQTVLHAFTGGPDGAQPYSGLTRDEFGNFYGTTAVGGDLTCNPPVGCGTVFELDRITGSLTTLHTFNGSTDGAIPLGDLVRDAAGNFYGTTENGGTFDYGVVFRLTP